MLVKPAPAAIAPYLKSGNAAASWGTEKRLVSSPFSTVTVTCELETSAMMSTDSSVETSSKSTWPLLRDSVTVPDPLTPFATSATSESAMSPLLSVTRKTVASYAWFMRTAPTK